jgi:Ca2+-binding EF-hand superfamily protein
MVTEPMTEEQKQACISIFHTHGIITDFSYYDGLIVKDGFIDETELYTAITNRDTNLSDTMVSAIISNLLADFDTNNDRKISLEEMVEYSKNMRPINPQVSQQVINQFVQIMNLIKVNSFATGSKEEFLNLVSQSTAIGERTNLMVNIYLPYQCQDGS